MTVGRTHILVGADHRVLAVRPLNLSGDYYQFFDYQAYPFDHQILKITLKTPLSSDGAVKFRHDPPETLEEKILHGLLPEIRDTEWTTTDVHSWHYFVPDLTITDTSHHNDEEDEAHRMTHAHSMSLAGTLSEKTKLKKGMLSKRIVGSDLKGGAVPKQRRTSEPKIARSTTSVMEEEKAMSSTGSYQITVQTEVQRKYLVHMFRVVLVMMIISLTANAALLPDMNSSSIERIGVLITLMLTAATYSQVIAISLPMLGYLTLLDLYVLITFSYLFVLALEIAILDYGFSTAWYSEADTHPDTGERMAEVGSDELYLMTYANLAFWALFHIGFTVYCRYVIFINRKQRIAERSQSVTQGGKANLQWSHLGDSGENISEQETPNILGRNVGRTGTMARGSQRSNGSELAQPVRMSTVPMNRKSLNSTASSEQSFNGAAFRAGRISNAVNGMPNGGSLPPVGRPTTGTALGTIRGSVSAEHAPQLVPSGGGGGSSGSGKGNKVGPV
jgi:hypothetical protein